MALYGVFDNVCNTGNKMFVDVEEDGITRVALDTGRIIEGPLEAQAEVRGRVDMGQVTELVRAGDDIRRPVIALQVRARGIVQRRADTFAAEHEVGAVLVEVLRVAARPAGGAPPRDRMDGGTRNGSS